MHPALCLLLLLLLPLASGASTGSQLEISVSKSPDGDWTVSYDLDVPATSLRFARNPNASRISRWKPLDQALAITLQDGAEVVTRKDGKEFYTAAFKLTPVYQHLPKDYAPFSPYSEGGILIHSGRLFACVDSCDGVNEWRFSLQVPKGEHILLNAELAGTAATWLDQGDGRFIYVGTQTPVTANGFVTLIDRGLPKPIREALGSDLSKMMSFFEKKLGVLDADQAPVLFASYSNQPGTSTQGGVLPNQIFIHWDSNDLDQKVKDPVFIADTLWTFAHEAAHFYQRVDDIKIYPDASQSWVHEGNAEMMAALALREVFPELDQYVDRRFSRAKTECVEGLKKHPLKSASDRGNFGLYYSCGLLIHQAIHEAVVTKSDAQHSLFTVWKTYQKRLQERAPASQETFLNAVHEFLSTDFTDAVIRIADESLTEPTKSLDALRHN